MKIVYANIPESIYDLRFLEALKEEYEEIFLVFFEKQKVKMFIPSGVRIVKLKDPSLLPIPLFFKLTGRNIEVGWILKTLFRGLIFKRCIKKIEPDLLFGHWLTGHYAFYCALSGFHPLLVGAWGTDVLVEPKKSWIFNLIARYTLRKADTVIVSAGILKDAVVELGCDEKKVWVFPWGIDLKKFNPFSDGSKIKQELGWNGNQIVISTRNHYQMYGIQHLVKAIPLVMREIPQARFLILGDGTLTEGFKEMARRLGVENCVSFPGKVPNDELSRYLNIADVYVSTSYSDGTSASLLESMACGLPCVVTDIPANREWIQNGVNGYLVPPKDSKTLADRIIHLLRNEKTRQSMGARNVGVSKARADWKNNVKIFYEAIQSSFRTGGRNRK